MRTKLIKRSLLMILSIASLFGVSTACDNYFPGIVGNPNTQNNGNNDTLNNKMKIIIGSKTFTATLHDNETVTTLSAMLPLTLNMSELNGNEKYFDFSADYRQTHQTPESYTRAT